MELLEWLASYEEVADYGFVALREVKGKKSASAVFEKIDNNGGGFVLLEEWCEFLKAAEIEAGTVLGRTLAEDEEGGVGKKWSAPKEGGGGAIRGKAPKGFKASTEDIKARARQVAAADKAASNAIKAAAAAKAEAARAHKLKLKEDSDNQRLSYRLAKEEAVRAAKAEEAAAALEKKRQQDEKNALLRSDPKAAMAEARLRAGERNAKEHAAAEAELATTVSPLSLAPSTLLGYEMNDEERERVANIDV